MIKKKRKSNKYVFILTGVIIDKLDDKYGIKIKVGILILKIQINLYRN